MCVGGWVGNYCIKCTKEEAHDEGYARTTNTIDCIQIHKDKTNEQNEESEMQIDEDKLHEIHNCDCGKPNKAF